MHSLRTLSFASLLLLGACSSDTKETTDTSTADGSGSDTGNGSGGGSGSGDAGPTCQTTNEGSGGAVCIEDTALCGDIYTPTSYRVTYARILKPAIVVADTKKAPVNLTGANRPPCGEIRS
jgi:hypothetical protein